MQEMISEEAHMVQAHMWWLQKQPNFEKTFPSPKQEEEEDRPWLKKKDQGPPSPD